MIHKLFLGKSCFYLFVNLFFVTLNKMHSVSEDTSDHSITKENHDLKPACKNCEKIYMTNSQITPIDEPNQKSKKKIKQQKEDEESATKLQNESSPEDEIILHMDESKTNTEDIIFIANRTTNYLPKTRRDKNPWTQEEIEKLLNGFKEFEKTYNKWQLIKNKYNFENRTPEDLRDKYRLLSKKTSYYNTRIRNFVVLDEHGKIMLDECGMAKAFKEKFPADAAVQIVKECEIKAGELCIGDKDNLECIYYYEVYYDSDNVARVRAKKADYVNPNRPAVSK